MSDRRRRRCTCCGQHDSVVGPISWRGNCLSCAEALQAENIVGIAERHGPAHRRRLRGIARWLDAELLEETRRAG